jgi:ATP-binding protein involved in chromosome partitioning
MSAPVPVLAVCSGKGGVGKTTVAVNLALALSAEGLKVGLVDADLYGPDAAHMLGLRRKTPTDSVPLSGAPVGVAERHGIQVASAAFLIGENQGLSVHASIAQLMVHRLLASPAWDARDCLVVDLPPGTGDVHQFVTQRREGRTSVLLVVTPQLVAHRDAQRMLYQLDHDRAEIVGGVENMAGQLCPHCGELTPLFPPAPAAEAIWTRVPLLASVPFSAQAAEDADRGRPVLLTDAVPAQVAAFREVARKVAVRLRT